MAGTGAMRPPGGAAAMLSLPARLLTDWNYFTALSALVLLAEAVFGAAIITKVAYTEIDWEAYMQEVGGYEAGELDYTKLRGGTGPLVYPAGFVYVFWVLKQLTDAGDNVRRAQWIFLGMYLVLTALVLAVYKRAGRGAMPPWVVLLLLLSKRVHSIFMLRLFNDGVSILVMYIAVLMVTRRQWTLASVWFSAALSIKMNILLFLPALGIIMLRNIGILRTAVQMVLIICLQALIGVEFLRAYPWAYLSRAFELSRVFFYKWTVNFRFLPEDVFVSKRLAMALLAATAVGIAVLVVRWARPGGGLSTLFGTTTGKARDSPRAMVLALFSSQLVGIVFSRTLHYQFYSWYFHTLPFLLWHTRLPVVVRLAVLAGVEYAFNVFPSTTASSLALQACHLVLLAAVLTAPGTVPDEEEVLATLNGERTKSHPVLGLIKRVAAAGGDITSKEAPSAVAVGVDAAGVTLETRRPNGLLLGGAVRRWRVPAQPPCSSTKLVIRDLLLTANKAL